jgi:hypothetical protein
VFETVWTRFGDGAGNLVADGHDGEAWSFSPIAWGNLSFALRSVCRDFRFLRIKYRLSTSAAEFWSLLHANAPLRLRFPIQPFPGYLKNIRKRKIREGKN